MRSRYLFVFPCGNHIVCNSGEWEQIVKALKTHCIKPWIDYIPIGCRDASWPVAPDIIAYYYVKNVGTL